MPIKLIALDVDGTLVNSRQEVTPATVQALQTAADRGIHVVLCTGRMLSECAELLQKLPMIHFAVTCTGTQTFDLRSGQSIARHSLTADELKLLCSRLWDLDVMLQIFDDRDGLMHNDAQLLATAERFCDSGLATAIRRYHVPEPDLRSYVEAYDAPTNKIHMFFGSAADKRIALERLQDLPYEQMDSMFTDLELMPPGIDKGIGLQDLAAYLQFEPAEVMAIGDGGNDAGMLRYAGLAVVMGNANDAVKAMGHRITDDHNHDGVAKAVMQVLEEQCHDMSD